MRVPRWAEKVVGFWSGFTTDGGGLLAAAVAYNALFALAPMLMLVVVATESLLGQRGVAQRLLENITGALGPEVAAQFARIVEAYAATRSERLGAGIIGVVLIVVAVAGLFGKLQQAFDMLWHVRPRADLPLAIRLRLQAARFLFALLPVAVAALAVIAAAATGWLAGLLGVRTDLAERVAESPLTGGLLGFAALVVLYRLLPYAEVRLADVLVPAATVTVAWIAGTLAFGLYLARGTGSAAAAAGSVFVLLLWLNFVAIVMLLGCSACRILAQKRGRGGPSEHAEEAVPHVGRD